MPTIKPPYKGDGAWSKTSDFSSNLRQKLREFYPSKDGQDPIFGDTKDGDYADEFVAEILTEASFALDELHWLSFDLTNEEIKKMQTDLLTDLKKTQRKLRRLPPDFDRLLGVDANPLGCADEIQKLIFHVEESAERIKTLPRSIKRNEKKHAIALEMATRVLRTANEHGMKISASASNDFGTASEAVLLLKFIGDDIGLEYAETTWRDIVAKSKE